MVNMLSYFPFQPVIHDWCSKDRGMYYPLCGIRLHFLPDYDRGKRPLAAIQKRVVHVVPAADFLCFCVSGTSPYVPRHITVKLMC